MREFNMIDVESLLERVRCPTLVLHSTRDMRVPVEDGRLLATRIPGAQYVTIDSGNHLLIESEPGWARAPAAIEAFLPAGSAPNAESRIAALSPRLLSRLDLMSRGRDNTQIAVSLGLS